MTSTTPIKPNALNHYSNPYGNVYTRETSKPVTKQKTDRNVVKLKRRYYDFLIGAVLVLGISFILSTTVMLGMVKHSSEFYRSNMQLKNTPGSKTLDVSVVTIDGNTVTFSGETHTYITKIPQDTLQHISLGEHYTLTYADGDLVSLVKQNNEPSN